MSALHLQLDTVRFEIRCVPITRSLQGTKNYEPHPQSFMLKQELALDTNAALQAERLLFRS